VAAAAGHGQWPARFVVAVAPVFPRRATPGACSARVAPTKGKKQEKRKTPGEMDRLNAAKQCPRLGSAFRPLQHLGGPRKTDHAPLITRSRRQQRPPLRSSRQWCCVDLSHPPARTKGSTRPSAPRFGLLVPVLPRNWETRLHAGWKRIEQNRLSTSLPSSLPPQLPLRRKLRTVVRGSSYSRNRPALRERAGILRHPGRQRPSPCVSADAARLPQSYKRVPPDRGWDFGVAVADERAVATQ